MDNQWKDIREIPANGKPKWSGGAYTIAFAYSNKGNFIVKGYYKEVNEYLEHEVRKGLKYVVNFTLWGKNPYTGDKHHRSIWKSSNNRTYVYEPSYKHKGDYIRRYKWKFDNSETDKTLTLKRFPKRWIPEFDDII